MTASARRRSLDPRSARTASVVEALFVHEPVAETRHLLIPRAEIEIMVRFRPAATRGIDAHALGARQQVRRKVLHDEQRTVSARLRPGASQLVLGVPASAIAGRIVALEDLWGEAAARRVIERLAAARDVVEAAALLDASIAERLGPDVRPPSARLALDAAAKLGDESVASATVKGVADELGVSERHLRRVFAETFGVGPKVFARLARFRRALRAAREGERAWAQIAADAGYYDQAHLVAEFRAIAGAPPGALLGELRATSPIG